MTLYVKAFKYGWTEKQTSAPNSLAYLIGCSHFRTDKKNNNPERQEKNKLKSQRIRNKLSPTIDLITILE